jgi:nucleoside-diphosphate-sugar epimerase
LMGLDVVRLRLFNTLGPGQGPALVGGGMVKRLREQMETGAGVLTVREPRSVRDFLDVRDIADVIFRVAGSTAIETSVAPLNVCSGEGLSIAALAGELLAASGTSVRLAWEGLDLKGSRVVGSNRTLAGILAGGAVKKISTLQSLADMWAVEIDGGLPVGED